MKDLMRWDAEDDSWYIEGRSGTRYPLHCGDAFLLQMGKTFMEASLELDSEWYVKMGNVKFWLHRKQTYTIQPIF